MKFKSLCLLVLLALGSMTYADDGYYEDEVSEQSQPVFDEHELDPRFERPDPRENSTSLDFETGGDAV
jgi:hypothetical protein